MGLKPAIRSATTADAMRVAEVYRPFVEDTAASFEEVAPSPDEIERRIESAHSWLVAEFEGTVCGYAFGIPHRSRHAYRFTTETSIYLDPDIQRAGIGKSLYAALLEELSGQGFATAVAGVTLPNEQSVAFHRHMGFSAVGRFPRVGFKFEKWHDTFWMFRPLN